jgi:ribonuclease HI
MTIIDIYTDGACKGNPGPGGWGAFLKSGDHEKDIFGGESQTTNNRMELMAVIEALKTLNNRSRIRLFIDSQYVKNGINIWISNWKKNGWRTSNKKAVKNVDLWMQLDELVPNHEIEWI